MVSLEHRLSPPHVGGAPAVRAHEPHRGSPGTPVPAGPYDLAYVDPGTRKPRIEPARLAGHLRLEDAPPVRGIPSYAGQRHLPGRYWFATTGKHVRYESLLERDILVVLDHAPSVVSLSSQAFRLCYREDGRQRRHVPDLFVRRADGSAMVVDVKRARDAARAENAAVFAATRNACQEAGWEYVVASEPEEPRMSNLRWLSGFRRTVYDPMGHAEALLTSCRHPIPLAELTAAVGPAALVRPVLFHLLWAHLLSVDLTRPLTDASPVRPTPATSLEAL